MKLYADRYFILSNKRRSDFPHPSPNEYLELSTNYHHETEKPLYGVDEDGNRVQLFDTNQEPFPSFFEIWEQMNSETPKVTKKFDDIKAHSDLNKSLSNMVFPGEVLKIKLVDLDYGFNPCIPAPHILEEKCKEIKIYGIEKESDFGLNFDIASEIIGGTYYKINSIFSEMQVQYSIVGYSIFKDFSIDPKTPQLDILSLVQNDKYFQFLGTDYKKSHPFLIEKMPNMHPNGELLIPGNKYTVILITCDQKGRWQLFTREFVTKKREATIEILDVRTEWVGDTDGEGDATTIYSVGITQNLNMPSWVWGFGFLPIIKWNKDHYNNEVLVLNSYNYKFTVPFQKYNINSKIIIFTWGTEGNGLDTDGEAWSHSNDLDWPPFLGTPQNLVPPDNGVISNHFSTGENENNPAFWGVVAVNRENKTSFVYHLRVKLTCRYQ